MSSCTIKPEINIRPRAVRINNVTIPRADIAQETQNHPADKPIEAWKAAARALAVRELLRQEAERLGVQAEPLSDDEGRRETEEEAKVRTLVEREVQMPGSDAASCQRYFEQNLRRFRSADLYEVSHILIGCRSAADRKKALEIAQQIIERLQVVPDAFAALAQQHSACPSCEVGGSLGQIGPGQTVAEFERAVAAARPGKVHPEPVESRYGFHILRVDRRIEGQQLPFDLVRERIAHFLDESVRRTAIRQYISLLAGRAQIEGIELNAALSPLVQ